MMAVEEATKLYEDRMKTIVLPTETLNQFLDLSTQYEEEARKEIVKRTRMEFSVMNEEKSREKCEALIKKHSAGLEKALAEGKFCVPGGHVTFKKNLKAIKQKYSSEREKGVKVGGLIITYHSGLIMKYNSLCIVKSQIALLHYQNTNVAVTSSGALLIK
ncbi:hypothetical protein AB205_0068060 [Aquarana catesbeiana]|uniref:Guanylate-binding protein/Atlastin C-terminal domain-containing protein n=1 Tax=Aquarana catesbeiana TaxID=8400 RepID=A0A2G9RG05_AQUCT|nr:hypothetical protein AB205_0068060 [Aquarana catesbeiana]